jgi:hypothetical protein
MQVIALVFTTEKEGCTGGGLGTGLQVQEFPQAPPCVPYSCQKAELYQIYFEDLVDLFIILESGYTSRIYNK